MTLNESTQQKVYDELRVFDSVRVSGHEPVSASVASVLSEGEVLADDGNQYESIQTAVDASTGWTFVGPGTYYENVVIDKNGFTLKGAGDNTLIDGGTVAEAIDIKASDVNVESLSVRTDPTNGTNAVLTNGPNATVYNCCIRDSGNNGIVGGGQYVHIRSVECKSASVDAFRPSDRGIVSNCIVRSVSEDGIDPFGSPQTDLIISNNVINGVGNTGITLSGDAHDTIVIGNRVHNSGNDGIETIATDTIIANNRVSGSGGSDINDTGTNTVLDSNITGSAN